MTNAIALVLVISLAGCSTAAVRRLNHAGLAVSSASLAIDWCQTRTAASGGWAGGYVEGGMPTASVIGPQPSAGAVDAYFVVGSVALIGAAQLVPEKYRPLAYVAISAVEIIAIRNNLETTNCMGVGR